MRHALLFAVLTAASCAAPAPSGPITLTSLPNINTDAMLTDIRKLASDEFAGRAPGTKGEQLTVQYFIDQFAPRASSPGNPDGSWTQKVPLVGLTPQAQGPFVVKKGGQTRPFKIRDEIVVFSKHVTDEVRLENSELVFAGYGVQAPEYQWDDFRGIDVKGKTIIVLVNDPPVTVAGNPKELDSKMFGGKAMTYYGRWTYKFEKAAELGAAGVFIVHETVPAGYPFNVVQGMGGERFDLVTPDKNAGRAKIEGWMSMEAATALLKMAGQDYQKLKAQAATRDFKPVALGATAIGDGQAEDAARWIHRTSSPNSPAAIRRSRTNTSSTPRTGIISGSANRSTATTSTTARSTTRAAARQVLEIARQLKKITPQPKRSLLFLMVTAEEQGLLGSQYYADFPLYPLEKTLANINIDGINQWGRTKDLVAGRSRRVRSRRLRARRRRRSRAACSSRTPSPRRASTTARITSTSPRRACRRSTRTRAPTSSASPPTTARQKRDEYTTADYHAPSDQVKPDWDLAGAADDGKLFLAIGYRIAQAEKFPEWKPGNEFRSIREKMLKGR